MEENAYLRDLLDRYQLLHTPSGVILRDIAAEKRVRNDPLLSLKHHQSIPRMVSVDFLKKMYFRRLNDYVINKDGQHP